MPRQIDDSFSNLRKSFEDQVKEVSDLFPNLSKASCSCFVVNYCDDFICKEHNGGCKSIETCARIKEKLNESRN